jgi:hypothetical protein
MKKQNWIGKFVFELVIVFVGVYGAFALNAYQQSQREKTIKLNYFQSFKSEVESLYVQSKGLKAYIDTITTRTENAIARNERPNLKRPKIQLSSALLITRAGLSDDMFVQISPGLAASLSGGYDNTQRVIAMIKEFNDLCNSNLVSKDPIEFYYKSGQLKPEFDWYLNDLKELSFALNGLMRMTGDQALPAIIQILEDLE